MLLQQLADRGAQFRWQFELRVYDSLLFAGANDVGSRARTAQKRWEDAGIDHRCKLIERFQEVGSDQVWLAVVGPAVNHPMAHAEERLTGKAETKGLMEKRDRMYTLVTKEYEKMRRFGAYMVGVEGVDEVVPPLGSRVRGHKKTEDTAQVPAAQTTTAPVTAATTTPSVQPSATVTKIAA